MRNHQLVILGLAAALAGACGSDGGSRRAAPAGVEPVAPTATAPVTEDVRAKLAAGPWAHHAGKLPFIVGFERGTRAARTSGKPAMYFFTTTWCGWCRKLANESFQDDETVRAIEADFTPVLVDGDTESAAAARFGVRGYPTVVFADEEGAAGGVVGGYQPREQFLRTVRDAAARQAR